MAFIIYSIVTYVPDLNSIIKNIYLCASSVRGIPVAMIAHWERNRPRSYKIVAQRYTGFESNQLNKLCGVFKPL